MAVVGLEPVILPQRKLPKVEISYEKCRYPFACKKCLKVCADMVFSVRCEKEERLKEANPLAPDVYKLRATRRDKCTLCNMCVEVCPAGAITITAP
jgi:ferredoxin